MYIGQLTTLSKESKLSKAIQEFKSNRSRHQQDSKSTKIKNTFLESKAYIENLIRNDSESHDQILQGVRQKISQDQYDCASIPFEIFQNADDAYLQAELINNEIVRNAIFYLESLDRKLQFAHWGRKINQFQGYDDNFDGRSQEFQYDLDLEKMLTLNASSKTEENSGKFGLGFIDTGIFSLTKSCKINHDLETIPSNQNTTRREIGRASCRERVCYPV